MPYVLCLGSVTMRSSCRSCFRKASALSLARRSTESFHCPVLAPANPAAPAPGAVGNQWNPQSLLGLMVDELLLCMTLPRLMRPAAKVFHEPAIWNEPTNANAKCTNDELETSWP
ncbi:unnamed protein product [Symbiodinium sp. CCMP2456]|nr:unnamed protein product [Symbiodinium sp. CCMP2456]